MPKGRAEKMEYRKKQLNFRVTDSEYEVIKEKMKLAGISSPSTYLRKMAMDGYVIRLDLSDLKELLRLAHIDSNNLNQYAKKANQTGSVYEADVQDLQERFNEFWSIGKELLARLSTIQ